jgi:2-keto-4-pentenoate hydratase/2-oxohepta-3-ene-1,7-dioic acid hydratase in catechol pathway
MRLTRFEVEDTIRGGIVDGDQVIDLSQIYPGTSNIDLIASFDAEAIERVCVNAPRHPIGDVRLLAPLVPQKNVIAVGRNYRDHATEFSASGFDVSEREVVPPSPVIFTKATTSVIGPDEPIALANDPTGSTDYEGEMAIVIGKNCRQVPRESAMDCVFGWTIVNDVTARDLQKRHVQWHMGKSPDTFCPIGPWIVTVDEVPDIENSWIRTQVNGELRQEAPIDDLIFSVTDLISILSETMTLEPGDVIATGTPKGVGIGFDPPRYLQSGDVVEVSIDRVGTLRNPVV